jgi:hypothetical protein
MVLAPDWLGPAQPFWRTVPSTLLGVRHLIAMTVFSCSAVGVSLLFLLVLVLLRIKLHKWWLWAPAFLWLLMGAFGPANVASIAGWIGSIAFVTSLLLLYTRLGLLAAIAFFFVSSVLASFPITADWNAWYWGSSLYALSLVAAVGVYGFYTSTTGRPLFGDGLARHGLVRQL